MDGPFLLLGHPLVMTVGLLRYLYSYKIGSWLCGAVEISRITVLASVKVALETVEDILYTCIDLQVDVVPEYERVSGLDVQVAEVRCRLHAVVFDVSCIVWNNH